MENTKTTFAELKIGDLFIPSWEIKQVEPDVKNISVFVSRKTGETTYEGTPLKYHDSRAFHKQIYIPKYRGSTYGNARVYKYVCESAS